MLDLDGFTTRSVEHGAQLRGHLFKLAQNGLTKSVTRGLLERAYGHPAGGTTDRRKRVPEAQVMLFNCLLHKVFAVNSGLGWVRSSEKFTTDGFRTCYRAELWNLAGISEEEFTEAWKKFKKAGLIQVDHVREHGVKITAMLVRVCPG